MKNKLRFVVDTNIFVSGLINEKGASAKVIDHFLAGHFDLIVSPEIYDEYKYVLKNSNLIDQIEATNFIVLLHETAIFCYTSNILDVCRDKSDNKFLEAAIEGSVDYLVTKNIKHFPDQEYQSIKIVKVSKALKAIEESIQHSLVNNQ